MLVNLINYIPDNTPPNIINITISPAPAPIYIFSFIKNTIAHINNATILQYAEIIIIFPIF